MEWRDVLAQRQEANPVEASLVAALTPPVEGPYVNAILRFEVEFPWAYPHRAPIIRFLSDVFHPLVTPLTTYTHTTRDLGSETVSASDDDKIPPGGFSLRHGFPEWSHGIYGDGRVSDDRLPSHVKDSAGRSQVADTNDSRPEHVAAPHIVEVLQYVRVVFDTEAALDEIPLEAAANSGAWHAWRSYRSKATGGSRGSSVTRQAVAGDSGERNLKVKQQQPGGARRPGEWNWQGVWEDRVWKSVQASISDPMLFGFGGDNGDVINFVKMNPEDVDGLLLGRSNALSA